MTTYENIWSSITVLCNELIEAAREDHPTADIRYIDWESANIDELPNSDLIGPTAVTMEDFGEGEIATTFAIGISTYLNDSSLFRQRQMTSKIHARFRPESKVAYYDRNLASQKSVLVVTSGTLISPMTRMNVRPWQYVQAAALLVPVSTS